MIVSLLFALLLAQGNTVNVTAVSSTFTPSRIVVPVGRTTSLRFINTQGVHALFSPELGIEHTTIAPGATTVVQIKPTHTGTYVLRCRIYCGPKHTTMILTIVVVT